MEEFMSTEDGVYTRMDPSTQPEVGESVEHSTLEEYRSGIVLQGWGQVEIASNKFAGVSAIQAPNQEEKRTLDDMLTDQGTAARDLLQAASLRNIGKEPELIRNFLKEAKQTILDKNRTKFEHKWEYDARGTRLFKNTLKVEVLDRDAQTFLLTVSADRRAEERLAAELGAPQLLRRISVQTAAETIQPDHFRVDLDRLGHVLSQALNQDIPAAQLTDAFKSEKGAYGHVGIWGGHFEMQINDLLVTVSFNMNMKRYTGEFDFDARQFATDQWRFDGNVLTGAINQVHEDNVKPQVIVSLMKARSDGATSLPAVVSQEDEHRIRQVADRIATALETK